MPISLRYLDLRRLGTMLFLVGAIVLTFASGAHAENGHQRAIGFFRLSERTGSDTPLRFGQDSYRTFILDRLRSLGIHAVGGESGVFSKDHSASAELVLGGIVREFECMRFDTHINCRFGLQWQVFDIGLSKIVYEVTARAAIYRIRDNVATVTVGQLLLTKALDSLLKRPHFTDLLRKRASQERENSFSPAGFKRCAAGRFGMPSQAPQAAAASVIIETERGGNGSGFFLNDEGLILSAAHVVAGSNSLSVRLQDGRAFPLDVIRASRSSDTALLRVRGDLKSSCLELSDADPKIGADVYAIGAPSSQHLAFTLTRGIVSGLREFEGRALLQTDAAVSPGSSGGPLLGSDGRAIAIMSWKVVGAAIEGLAFGVPIRTALLSLSITPADATAEELRVAMPEQPREKVESLPFIDVADRVPSLDPGADYRRAQQAQAFELERTNERRRQLQELEEERDSAELSRLTPGYVKIMKWGGLALASTGLIVAAVNYASYDFNTSTKSEYESLRHWNELGLAGVGVGLGLYGASLILAPRLPDHPRNSAPRSNRREMGAFVRLGGSY